MDNKGKESILVYEDSLDVHSHPRLIKSAEIGHLRNKCFSGRYRGCVDAGTTPHSLYS